MMFPGRSCRLKFRFLKPNHHKTPKAGSRLMGPPQWRELQEDHFLLLYFTQPSLGRDHFSRLLPYNLDVGFRLNLSTMPKCQVTLP